MPSSNHHPNPSNACHPQTRHWCDQMRWGLGPTRWSWETVAQNNNLEDVCISAGGERFHFQGTDWWYGGPSLDMQRMTLHQWVIERRCAKWKQGLFELGQLCCSLQEEEMKTSSSNQEWYFQRLFCLVMNQLLSPHWVMPWQQGITKYEWMG
jgi:hypothetical protein